jgi:hypothetical protein
VASAELSESVDELATDSRIVFEGPADVNAIKEAENDDRRTESIPLSEESGVDEGSTVESVSLVEVSSAVEDCVVDTDSLDVISGDDEE